MSDPVTNAEVEDVLSSIRRLVSEDKRPMQAFKEPEPQAAEPSDRLVLTPALRVADAPAVEEGADTADAPQSADDFARDVQQMTAAAEPAHAEIEVSDAGNGGETVEADLHKLFEDEASSEEQTAPDQDYSDDPYGFADDEDVAELYSGAECVAFPSLYEGFGFPVLESMACGTAVVTSNVSSLPEVAGNATLMVDPYNVEAIADAIQQIITDSKLKQTLIARGFEQAKKFTWENSAKNLQKIYQTVLSS